MTPCCGLKPPSRCFPSSLRLIFPLLVLVRVEDVDGMTDLIAAEVFSCWQAALPSRQIAPHRPTSASVRCGRAHVWRLTCADGRREGDQWRQSPHVGGREVWRLFLVHEREDLKDHVGVVSLGNTQNGSWFYTASHSSSIGRRVGFGLSQWVAKNCRNFHVFVFTSYHGGAKTKRRWEGRAWTCWSLATQALLTSPRGRRRIPSRSWERRWVARPLTSDPPPAQRATSSGEQTGGRWAVTSSRHVSCFARWLIVSLSSGSLEGRRPEGAFLSISGDVRPQLSRGRLKTSTSALLFITSCWRSAPEQGGDLHLDQWNWITSRSSTSEHFYW